MRKTFSNKNSKFKILFFLELEFKPKIRNQNREREMNFIIGHKSTHHLFNKNINGLY